jgi:hypothetical protein
VFPSDEDEDGGAGGVGRGGVGACECVLHNASYAIVVVFRVCDIGTMPCVMDVTTGGRKDNVFGAEGVVGV